MCGQREQSLLSQPGAVIKRPFPVPRGFDAALSTHDQSESSARRGSESQAGVLLIRQRGETNRQCKQGGLKTSISRYVTRPQLRLPYVDILLEAVFEHTC